MHLRSRSLAGRTHLPSSAAGICKCMHNLNMHYDLAEPCWSNASTACICKCIHNLNMRICWRALLVELVDRLHL